jgi:glycine/D-amino acid oxidase-like deaminating enzyme
MANSIWFFQNFRGGCAPLIYKCWALPQRKRFTSIELCKRVGGYEYWQQLSDGRIVLGEFRDHSIENKWTHSTESSDLIQDKLTTFLRSHLKVQAPITHRWAASVGYTDDALPITEEVRAGVWAIDGYNGTGNVIGALCGRMVVTVVATGRSDRLLHRRR